MDVKEPTVPVYANYTAEPYTKGTAKELLTQQVAHPVRWQQTVEKMIEAGVDTFVEVGSRQNAVRPHQKDEPRGEGI